MILSLTHIGSNPVKASSIIEMTVMDSTGNDTFTECITDLNGHVDENLIIALRDIANELEDQNRLAKKN